MADSEGDKIYIAKVKDDKKETYAIHHDILNDGQVKLGHLNYSLSREGLVGYIEGALARRYWNVEIVPDIPSHIRRGSFPSIVTERVEPSELVKLIEEAGLSRRINKEGIIISTS